MATATSFQSTTLKKHEEVAEQTMAFYFAKPAGFDYRAGQSVDLTLIDPPETDAEGNTRTFTLSSAPADPDLMITTRMRDTAFKRVLGRAAPGTQLKLEGPSGSFTLHKNTSKPAVFLAGGIGITPFRSIIRDALGGNNTHQLHLFYSNHRPEDAPFLGELQQLAQQHSRFQLIATMTQMARSQRSWNGYTGFIDQEMVRRHVPSLGGPVYYIAGPPAMVAAMRRILVAAAVDEDDIRTEEFSGY